MIDKWVKIIIVVILLIVLGVLLSWMGIVPSKIMSVAILIGIAVIIFSIGVIDEELHGNGKNKAYYYT